MSQLDSAGQRCSCVRGPKRTLPHKGDLVAFTSRETRRDVNDAGKNGASRFTMSLETCS